jgi:hypothetical protein
MYIPPGFGTVTPYFVVADAERFVVFLVKGLGGREILRSMRPDGRIANAQVALVRRQSWRVKPRQSIRPCWRPTTCTSRMPTQP